MSALNLFGLASFVLALTWSVVLAKQDRLQRRHLGVVGAWMATIVVTALDQAAHLPQVSQVIQLVPPLWLGSMGLLAVDAGMSWNNRPRRWKALLALALLCLAIHVAASLLFFWHATVSPGGV